MSDFARKLRQASFRGIAFYISEATDDTERRHTVHEYPQKDTPYIEDLGKGAQSFTLQVFLIGEACVQQAKALRKAVLSGKTGTLVHPFEGSIRVFGTKANFNYQTSVLRYVSGSISFVEAGELDNPAGLKDFFSWAGDLSKAIEDLGIDEFVDKILGNPIYGLVDSVLSGDVVGILDSLGGSQFVSAFGMAESIGQLKDRAVYLLHNSPIDYASELTEYVGLSRFSNSSTNWSSVPSMVQEVNRSEAFNLGTNRMIEQEYGDSLLAGEATSQINQNRAALETLTRQALLAQAINASTLIGTKQDNPTSDLESFFSLSPSMNDLTDETITGSSYDDVIASRDMLLGLIDDELENPLTSDKMYGLLSEAHSAVFGAMTERAEGLSRLIEVKMPQVMPSVVLAYDFHDDATREAEIVTRNHVQNAGFCPIQLKVMSR